MHLKWQWRGAHIYPHVCVCVAVACLQLVGNTSKVYSAPKCPKVDGADMFAFIITFYTHTYTYICTYDIVPLAILATPRLFAPGSFCIQFQFLCVSRCIHAVASSAKWLYMQPHTHTHACTTLFYIASCCVSITKSYFVLLFICLSAAFSCFVASPANN